MHICPPNGPDDMREIIRINKSAKEEVYGGILPDDVLEKLVGDPSDAEEMWTVHEEVQDEHHGIFIAEDNGNIAGYTYFRYGIDGVSEFVDENEAEISELYTRPGSWRGGIGTALLERGLEFLPSETTALKLEIFPMNGVAQSFYKKYGFEQISTYESKIEDESYQMNIYTLPLN